MNRSRADQDISPQPAESMPLDYWTPQPPADPQMLDRVADLSPEELESCRRFGYLAIGLMFGIPLALALLWLLPLGVLGG